MHHPGDPTTSFLLTKHRAAELASAADSARLARERADYRPLVARLAQPARLVVAVLLRRPRRPSIDAPTDTEYAKRVQSIR